MSKDPITWLPNMVAGVSIWKLARDLNEPKFFDGRLLVPETEGSDSLPTKVRWNLTGLTPLSEARTKWPDETSQAVRDFSACLERAGKELGNPESGYHKYKDAFTVPSLEAGDSYFYDPVSKKLSVVNWGASPREFGGKGEFFFGYDAWDRLFEDEPVAAAAPAAPKPELPKQPEGQTPKKAEPPKKKEEPKKEGQRAGAGGFWRWVLIILAAIALLLLAAFLFKRCQGERARTMGDAGSSADAATSSDAEAGALATGDASADAADASDASLDAARDAEAGTDGGDASDAGDGGDGGRKRDAGADGGKKAGGGPSKIFPTGKPGSQTGNAGGPGGQFVVPGGGPGGPGVGGPGGPAGPGQTIPRTKLPHRRHFHPEATAWQIKEGLDVVVYAEMQGKNFVVWLEPEASFDELIVEWQDKDGQWHE